MRITIDLEPHELQAAKELIDALKSITDRLAVNTTTSAPPHGVLGPSPTPPSAMASTAVAAPVPGNQASGLMPSHPPHHLAPASAYMPPPLAMPPPAPIQPPPATSPSPQASSSGKGGLFWTILQNFTDTSLIDSVVGNLSAALTSRADNPTAAMTDLVDAFEALFAYDAAQPGLSLDSDRVERYFMLLNHKLPEHLDAELRKNVLQRVVRQLTKVREVSCDRAELWPAAVGFGCLVALECVKITGALAMIERQLAKTATLAAAVTMLGNVLCMCGALVCTAPAEQRKVWQVVDSSSDFQSHPCFEADRNYFKEWRSAVGNMGEPPTGLKYQPLGAPPHSAPAPPASSSLANGNSMHQGSASAAAAAAQDNGAGAAATGLWHIQQIAAIQMGSPGVAIAWDSASGNALVAGSDGSLAAWNVFLAQESVRLPSPAGGLPVTLMSTDPQRGHVLLAANPTPNSMHTPHPYLALHDTLGGAGLPCRGACSRRGASHVSSVLLLSHEAEMAVSCETWPTGAAVSASSGGGGAGPVYPVCLWSTGRLGEAGQAQELPALHTWTDGHTAPVTCSAASEYQPCTFFTGAADGVVRVWDTRMRSPAGSLQGTNVAPARAHDAGVAVMECQAHVLVTGGCDAMGSMCVCIWDVRALGQPSVNAYLVASAGVPLYKLAYREAPSPTMAAIALGSGLYLLDWTNANSTMSPFPGYVPDHSPMNPSLVQHDIAWATSGSTPTLVSISTQPVMSVFSVR